MFLGEGEVLTASDLFREHARLCREDPANAESFFQMHKCNEDFRQAVIIRREMIIVLERILEEAKAGRMTKSQPCSGFDNRNRSHRRRRYCHGR